MSNTPRTHSKQLHSSNNPLPRPFVIPAFAVWLGLIVWMGAMQAFVTPPGRPPFPLLVAVLTPVLLFFCVYRISEAFREFVLSADLRFMTGIQAWRIGGFAFLVLYEYGILPGYFAWPAGLGDMAIGITAPWIVMALIRRQDFAASSVFLTWNIFGILDLIVAVGMGALGPRFLEGVSQSGTAPMAHLPLVLIPGFFVPMYIVFHFAALFQALTKRTRKHSS